MLVTLWAGAAFPGPVSEIRTLPPNRFIEEHPPLCVGTGDVGTASRKQNQVHGGQSLLEHGQPLCPSELAFFQLPPRRARLNTNLELVEGGSPFLCHGPLWQTGKALGTFLRVTVLNV